MMILGQFSRIDLAELKAQIVRTLGLKRSEKYFYHLNRLLSMNITKHKFDKLCLGTIGRENIALHNKFIQSILQNACLSKSPPAISTQSVNSANGCQSSLTGNSFPGSPRKRRSVNIRECRFRDRPSPLGRCGKFQGVLYDELLSRSTENGPTITGSGELKGMHEQQSEVVSVEDGEEVEQMDATPYVQSRNLLRAPFGMPLRIQVEPKARVRFPVSEVSEICCNSYVLPDPKSLKKRLEQKLEIEGLDLTVDCVNLLNRGLDLFLKRLIMPCLELARARHDREQQGNKVGLGENMQILDSGFSASLLDFKVAMELKPQILGNNWHVQLEKICQHSAEE